MKKGPRKSFKTCKTKKKKDYKNYPNKVRNKMGYMKDGGRVKNLSGDGKVTKKE